jgi:hypothetical protein
LRNAIVVGRIVVECAVVGRGWDALIRVAMPVGDVEGLASRVAV